MMNAEVRSMSNSFKFQYIHDSPKARREWIKGDLSKAEKLYVLEGMDLGVSETWILSLIEEAREMRQEVR